MIPPDASAPTSVTVKIHGNSRLVEIALDGVSVKDFISKIRDAFAVPDNATPLVNGQEADANVPVKPGDTVTFQTRAAAKAAA